VALCVSASRLITHIDRPGDTYRRMQRVQGTYSAAAIRTPAASRPIEALTRQSAFAGSAKWKFRRSCRLSHARETYPRMAG